MIKGTESLYVKKSLLLLAILPLVKTEHMNAFYEFGFRLHKNFIMDFIVV